jgi:hypothetical protein
LSDNYPVQLTAQQWKKEDVLRGPYRRR